MRVEDALGSHLTDYEIRDEYDLSPPELSPFAATGCDGGHFGYVIHAPELPATDYPVGRFEPSDHDDGVYLLGATIFEVAETELSFQMQCDQEFGLFRSPFSSECWPEVAARLRGLGIEPNLANAGRNFENDNGKPVTPLRQETLAHRQARAAGDSLFKSEQALRAEICVARHY
jgi:hypothetical protein